MAKKKTTASTGTTKSGILRALAYIGLVVSALVFLLGGILNLCGLSAVSSLLSQIASVVLLVAVAWPAWDFCKSKAKWIRILYFIALILYILGLVFGFLKM